MFSAAIPAIFLLFPVIYRRFAPFTLIFLWISDSPRPHLQGFTGGSHPCAGGPLPMPEGVPQ
jgi:hypothetical protein